MAGCPSINACAEALKFVPQTSIVPWGMALNVIVAGATVEIDGGEGGGGGGGGGGVTDDPPPPQAVNTNARITAKMAKQRRVGMFSI